MFMKTYRYRLQLKRKNMVMFETFVGTKLGLWIYMFQMRKWEIKIID